MRKGCGWGGWQNLSFPKWRAGMRGRHFYYSEASFWALIVVVFGIVFIRSNFQTTYLNI